MCSGLTKRPTLIRHHLGNARPKLTTRCRYCRRRIAVNGWNQGELYSFHSGVCVVGWGRFGADLADSLDLSVLIRMAARGDGNPYTLD